jgi:hypothetical protein
VTKVLLEKEFDGTRRVKVATRTPKVRKFPRPHGADDRALMGLRALCGRSSGSVVGLWGSGGPGIAVPQGMLCLGRPWEKGCSGYGTNQISPLLALVRIERKSDMVIAGHSNRMQEVNRTNRMSNRMNISPLWNYVPCPSKRYALRMI